MKCMFKTFDEATKEQWMETALKMNEAWLERGKQIAALERQLAERTRECECLSAEVQDDGRGFKEKDAEISRLKDENKAIKERYETLYKHHEGAKKDAEIAALTKERDEWRNKYIKVGIKMIIGSLETEDIEEEIEVTNVRKVKA
jgi:hypothetical protein